MTQERIPVDISNEPSLMRLAREAMDHGISFVLQDGDEDVAILSPARKTRKRGARPLTEDDPLFRLVGMGRSGVPGGVSGKKHEALLRAKRS
jgi:hypothetical protein